jgi:hypothetical protein
MSTDYLKNLSLAHGALLETMSSVQPFLRSYLEAKPRLREFNQRLLLFFGKEDQVFFDALYAFYKEDHHAMKMIDFLKHDLAQIKINYLTFFDAHSVETADVHARSFPKDFTTFAEQIIARIKIEEEYLFPLLEKMVKE